jgi:DNA-directed RNA polymerase specialized sigma24 family protein
VEDDCKPWWEDDPELEEIRRRTLEEFSRGPEDREPIDPDAPDPVVADFLGGASWRELAIARDELTRARARYEDAVLTARAAGLSWAEIGRVLRVSKQLLHRRFRTQSG